MDLDNNKRIQRITSASKIIHSAIAAATLMTAMTCMAYSLSDNKAILTLGLVLSFFLLTVSRMIMFLTFRKDKVSSIKYRAYTLAYFLCTGLSIGFYWVDVLIAPIAGLYFTTIVANRIISIFMDKRKGNLVYNVLMLAIVAVLSLLSIGSGAAPSYYSLAIVIIATVIAAQALMEVVIYAFSSIKLHVLLKVIRKTYAGEILLGLILLIVSFSFVFYMTEDSFGNYLNALWYSFAIVTTIGFGDFYAVGDLGRVLSVILGIYGIIVVAVLTSIIVNFYNETKDDKDDKDKKEKDNPEEAEDSPKEIEEKSKEKKEEPKKN
ncbi:MAG: potassium channel family protein [Bacilli bacterium]|nr:potassium channel family protein [Bacilli bacterium]